MPCYRPISIANPSRKYNGDMPVYLKVPCGKCEGCRQRLRQDWFFRSYIEYIATKKKGGVCFTFTLTFNDENLPFYTTASGERIACFDKRYIHNFIKYFRILMKKSGYYHKEMKYLICSEYGETTHRPHHHGLMFFPFHLPVSVFLKHLRTAWHYGFVGRGSLGFEVVSPSGLEYVTKYITKAYGEKVWNLPNDNAPRHWQSVGYGSDFLNVLNKDTINFLVNNRYSLNHEKSNLLIPRYYHQKLERVINKDISKRVNRVVTELTDIGKQVRLKQFHNRIENDVSYLRTLSLSTLEGLFPVFSAIKNDINISGLFAENEYTFNAFRNDTISCIYNGLLKLNLRKVALYRSFLRFYPIHKELIDPAFYLLDVDSLYLHTLETKSVPPEYIEYGVSETDNVSTPLRDDKKRLSVLTCRNHWYYRKYERVSSALDLLALFSGLSSDYANKYKFRKNKIIKEIYSKYVEFKSL